jgi:uncharacterized protein
MSSVVAVEGTAIASARPDEVEMSLAVTYTDTSAHQALSEVATRSAQVEQLLSELGIEERQWTTSGAVVSEHTEWNRETGQQVHRGYVATNRIVLRLDDASQVGRLMNEATRRAQARISGPWWRIAPDNPAHIEACKAAALDARRKAEAYASALDARLGVVLEISEPGIDVEPVPRMGMAKGMALMSAEAPSEINVHAGDLQVSANVIVKFALHTD